MSEYSIVTPYMVYAKENFLKLLDNYHSRAMDFIKFSNSFLSENDEQYTGCNIHLYELDGDENKEGEEIVKWSINFEANTTDEITFTVDGYVFDRKFIFKDINDKILIEQIGESSYLDKVWNEKLKEVGVLNDKGDLTMTEEEFSKQYKEVETEYIDLYAEWCRDTNYKVSFNPFEGVL